MTISPSVTTTISDAATIAMYAPPPVGPPDLLVRADNPPGCSDGGSSERGQSMEYVMGVGMVTVLISIIVVSGSIVAIVFRRMVLRNEKRDEQPQP